jgi:hypothetical protein
MTVENAISASILPQNVTGRFAPLPFTQIITMARGLQPDAEQLVIIAGLASIDSIALSVALNAASALPKLEVVVIRELTYANMLAKVRRLSPKSIIVVAYCQRDTRGQLFVPGEVISAIARAAPAPVYTYSRNLIGEGALGGAVTKPDDEGVRTAQLVTQVLRRRPNEPMPAPVLASTELAIDWRQLRRFGLAPARLPPGTEILFRTSTVWERYRVPIFGISVVIVAQFALIALLLMERRRRMRAQAVEEQRCTNKRSPTSRPMLCDTRPKKRRAPPGRPRSHRSIPGRDAPSRPVRRRADASFDATSLAILVAVHQSHGQRRLQIGLQPAIDSGLQFLVADARRSGHSAYRPDVRQDGPHNSLVG